MAVDSFFKRIGFASSLYEDALTAARERGVSGAEATAFIRKLVLSPSDAMLDKATERALKFGFAEPLSRGAAATAQNPVVQLFLSPFLSFQLRFARWLAEFTPASPEFLGKLRAGNATAEDLVKYAARQVAGLGAIGLVDATLYDQIDFNTFEYVDSDTGKRTSLAGLSPLPEAIAMAAILRREPSKALAAMKRSSVTFFFSAGALSGVLNVLNNVRSGQEIPQRIADQVSLALFGWIPAQAILKSLKDMLDRTQRQGGFPEGIIGRLPVVSKTVPPRISPTTGRQLEIERTILASRIPAPEVLGRRLTQQVPEPVEREFRRLSQLGFPIQIYAPRVRLKGLELDEDVPEEIQREFERIRGLAIHKLISPVVSKAGYERLPDAKKLEILRDLRSMATSLATEHAQRAYDETYGATIEQTKAQ